MSMVKPVCGSLAGRSVALSRFKMSSHSRCRFKWLVGHYRQKSNLFSVPEMDAIRLVRCDFMFF